MLSPWQEQPQPLSGVALEEANPNESILRHYWRILYRRRWIVLAVLGSCIALAVLVSMLTQRQFTASTKIEVAREAAKVINMEGVENDNASPLLNNEFYQTQYELLESRSISEAVVRSLGLAENYDFLSDFNAGATAELQRMSREARFALATEKVNENTIVSPVRGSSVIDLGYEAPDPILAASVANTIAEKFIEANLTRRFEATAYARQFLQNRLNAVRARLEESERRATDYARQQGLINIVTSGGGGEVASEQPLVAADLAQLSGQLTIARAERAKAEADYRASTGGAAAERMLVNEAVNSLRRQRSELTGELRKLESDFGPEYPRVVALRAQLNELNKQIAQEEGVVRTGVNQDLHDRYRQALAAEKGLQSRVAELKNAVLDQQQRSIQFNIIQRDVDTNRALYEALLQRFKEIGVAGGIGTNNVSVVDPALPPEDPSSPNLPLNLALGLVFGLALGAGAAIVLEQLAESMILPSEFQRKLGIPLLGSTPATKDESSLKLLGSTGLSKRNVENRLGDTQSELSEAYFSILTAVQFSTAKGAPKTLSVTSSQPSEGKSTTAIALAKAMAGVGARVLIIDADMRNPSLHKSFSLKSDHGLSDVLTGKVDLMKVVQPTDTQGLSAVPAGPRPPNPAELLASGALEETLKVAAGNFDHVIVDGPPVLGLADAPLIARATEGTVFVVESGRTRSSQARQALERLFRVRAHLLGAVLTKLDSRSSGYGYGYGYNYSYGSA